MLVLKLALAFILSSIACANVDQLYMEKHVQSVSGIEFIIRGNGVKPFGRLTNLSQFLGNQTEMVKLKEGKLVYKAVYTVDLNGFRNSQSSHLAGKTSIFLLSMAL